MLYSAAFYSFWIGSFPELWINEYRRRKVWKRRTHVDARFNYERSVLDNETKMGEGLGQHECCRTDTTADINSKLILLQRVPIETCIDPVSYRASKAPARRSPVTMISDAIEELVPCMAASNRRKRFSFSGFSKKSKMDSRP